MQTRVGYAGAAAPMPTYRDIRGHAEVFRVTFDPARVDYAALLERYRERHTPRRGFGQYRSILFPQDEHQLLEIQRYLRRLAGDAQPEIIAPNTPEARFWDAEDYHQKYRLRRNHALVRALEDELGADWDRWTIATKLNALRAPGFDASPWLATLSPAVTRALERA